VLLSLSFSCQFQSFKDAISGFYFENWKILIFLITTITHNLLSYKNACFKEVYKLSGALYLNNILLVYPLGISVLRLQRNDRVTVPSWVLILPVFWRNLEGYTYIHYIHNKHYTFTYNMLKLPVLCTNFSFKFEAILRFVINFFRIHICSSVKQYK